MGTTESPTVKDLLLGIQYYISYLWKKKFWILAFSIIVASIMFLWAKQEKPKYNAELTFMIYQDENSSMSGGLSSMLGAIGLKSPDKVNLEKIIELSKTDRIIFQTYFDSIQMNGVKDLTINHFIKLYSLDRKFDKPIRFTSTKFDAFNDNERVMLNIVQDLLLGKNAILDNSFGVKTGIMKFSLSSLNQDLSIEFVKNLFKHLSDFYINKSIEKDLQTYNLLKGKVERLYNKMNGKEYASAEQDNKSLGVWQETERLPSRINKRDATITSIVYSEAVKNLEITEFTLQNKTPFIQQIDVPFKPLFPITKSIVLYTILGLIIGISMSSILFILRLYIKNIF
ncbi:MAG: hypothetical protein IPL69_05900 [Saprospiraceae bacterium]|nr:hypothetical protein [Candidatus Brachybacter algidus]